MEIQGERPIDSASRRRQIEAARGQRAGSSPAAPARPDASYSAGDAAAIKRLVSILSTMNPVDVQRIDELKASIADGTYQADPNELADLLLGRGGSPAEA